MKTITDRSPRTKPTKALMAARDPIQPTMVSVMARVAVEQYREKQTPATTMNRLMTRVSATTVRYSLSVIAPQMAINVQAIRTAAMKPRNELKLPQILPSKISRPSSGLTSSESQVPRSRSEATATAAHKPTDHSISQLIAQEV